MQQEAYTPPGAERFATAPVMRLGDLIGALREDATAATEARRTGQPRGPVTGIVQLDDTLGGALQAGQDAHGGLCGRGVQLCAEPAGCVLLARWRPLVVALNPSDQITGRDSPDLS